VNATSAEVRFGAAGVATVASHLYPAASTYVECFTYPGKPPVLVIRDGHVEVIITAPDPGQVSAGDLAWGRSLAEAAARYTAELERRHIADGGAVTGPAHPADRAA
jgi:hypothetical protein